MRGRPYIGPPGLLMAEAEMPDKFWPAIRLVVNNLVWILPLVAIEQMVTGEVLRAAVIGVIFVADLVVAVKWGRLDAVVKKAGRMSGVQLALLIGVLGTWASMTLGLGAAAWMIWHQQGFATGSSAIGVGAKADDRPLQWVYNFTLEGGFGRNVFSVTFRGANTSKNPVHIKDANLVSLIDGTLLPLEIVGVDSTTDENRIVPIDRVQLISPGAPIQLVAKFGPPDPSNPDKVMGLDSKVFLERWRQFSFNVKDETNSYKLEFNENSWMPFFQGKVGPRVMIKP